ncbi:MAG TPA: hypothetical protein DCX53_12325, partial [Anaerolineae bacterium]|nr:hypothetical protein [Anaerolineae bacterium]
MIRKLKFFASGFLLTLLTACGSANEHRSDNVPQAEATMVPIPITSHTPIVLEQATLYTTQNDLTGNHVINGTTDLLDATTLDIPLDGKPTWLVSAPFKDGVVLTAIMNDGKALAFKISGQSFEPFDISTNILPAGLPPVLAVTEADIQLITPPSDASQHTNPILIGNNLIYIASNGDLVSSNSISQTRLPINALIDSRILMDENNRLLILTQPTDRYNHGVLGDAIEASAITLVETSPKLRVMQTILIEAPDVIEGLSPIWADLDNDGVKDIIVTLSNDRSGARIVVYREDGMLLAETPPIGLGHRWRHQIAVAEFEAGGP